MTATYRRELLDNFILSNPVYADVEVTVYEADDNGLLTATLATLYEAQTGTTQLQNPQTLDAEGKFGQPVYFDVPVICVIDGLDVGQQQTGVIRPQLDTTTIENAQVLAQRALARALDDDWLLAPAPI